MKIKVSEATEIQIDWLVAKCEGHDVVITTIAEQAERFNNSLLQHGEKPPLEAVAAVIAGLKPRLKHGVHLVPVPSYSTDWSQGGPIIERERLTTQTDKHDNDGEIWSAYKRENLFNDNGTDCWMCGPTPLIAAMRCFVVSKLGEEVDVPEELT